MKVVDSCNQDYDLENDNLNYDDIEDGVVDGEAIFVPKSECKYIVIITGE